MPRLLSLATLYPNAHTPRFGTFVARSLEALAARGDWQVTVINPIGTPPFAPGRYAPLARAAISGIEHGVAVHRPRFLLIPAIGGPLNPALIARAVLPLARRLHAEQPFDLVDAQFFYPDGPAAARVARTLGLPLAIKARGADIAHWGTRPSPRRQMLAAADHAAGLLAVSGSLREEMAAIGLPRDRIAIHYTGLDRELFHPRNRASARAWLAAEHGVALAPGETLLACVGALIPRKGQEIALRALAQLPPATHLALVGTGPDSARLAALAGELGLAARVHFLGSIDHAALPQVLSAAQAMVLPTASEGLANAWVEALACGTPLVTCDVGGARELMQVPAAGRLVARDAAAVAAGVREVLAADYPPETVAAQAARFSWEANAAALAEIYAGLISPT